MHASGIAGTHIESQAPGPLSRRLWGIDWRRLLPEPVGDTGVMVEAGSLSSSYSFVRDHYDEIFQIDPGSPFLREVMSPAKRRYYEEVGDFFEFRKDGRMVSLIVGTPVDWSTYYIRSAATLPRFQGGRFVPTFLHRLFGVLRSVGVERVEAETSPANLAVVQILTHQRFNVTGTVLSERWGALIRLTKYLDSTSTDVFLDRFCSGVKYQKGDVHYANRQPSAQTKGGHDEEEIRTGMLLRTASSRRPSPLAGGRP